MCNYRCAYCPLYMKRLEARRIKYHTFSTCPKSTQRLMENETMRKQSFLKFKASRAHYRDNYKVLAKNGFYYYGKKTEIRCSYCKLVIVKLNDGDDIKLVHCRHSPECLFNDTAAPSAPNFEDVSDNSNHHDVAYRYERMYPDLSTEFNDDKFTDDIFSNDKDETSVVINDSKKLGVDDIMCKICFERERDTCFLPCRHVSTCSECAKRCKVCCICREKIRNKLEIYLQ